MIYSMSMSSLSLGGMIVRALFSKPTTISRRLNMSHAFHKSFPLMHLSGYTERNHYYTQRDYMMNKGEDVNTRSIRKGDIIKLNDLLFTRNRDHLIRNNNQHVKAEQLKGKVIGVYFLPLGILCSIYSHGYPSLLKDVYDDLQSFNKFEVVMVAYTHFDATERNLTITDLQKHFKDYFSCMPWTAIPFSDVVSRERMQSIFGVHESYASPTMFVVDPTGMVLQCDAWDIFEDFGALGYPFSDERMEILRAEDAATAKQISLKTVLASPKRDYVISNNGDKVSIHTLEDKVVALYFYNVDADNDSLTERLKSFYKELKKINKKFEVVLVYIEESIFFDWDREESFWEEFRTMPWLARPFGDKGYKKFSRIFELSKMTEYQSELVIFGPHSEFIDPFGAHVLFRYNISTYPFTCKKVAELDTEKIKELKLEMLWNPINVFKRNDGSQVSFSQLSGKRVMLILERFGVKDDFGENSPNTKFLQMLKRRYLQTAGTNDEFEVIRIFIPNLEFYTSKSLGDMPNWSEPLGDTPWLIPFPNNLGATSWLVSLSSELIHDLGSYFVKAFPYGDLKYYLPIFAFSQDGTLVRKTMFPTFEDVEFPFYAGSLEEEKLSQLTKPFSSECVN